MASTVRAVNGLLAPRPLSPRKAESRKLKTEITWQKAESGKRKAEISRQKAES